MKIPRGTSWTAPVDVSRARGDNEDGDADADEEVEEIPVDERGEAGQLEEFFSDAESTSGEKGKKKKKKKSKHVEEPNFSGDRVLANEVLFLQDMGWWVIAAHAVPDGEMGRVWEIMKVFCSVFSSIYICLPAAALDFYLHRVLKSQLLQLPSRDILSPSVRGLQGIFPCNAEQFPG